MATEDVLKFMQAQNRPFSVNDVLQSVGKEYGKAAIQKALDKLISQKKVFEKIFDKQKVYCILQEEVDVMNMQEDLKVLDREINDFAANLKETENEMQTNMAELSSLQNKMTTAEAEKTVMELQREIEALKENLEDFADNASEPISNEEKLKINKEYEHVVKEYKKRKRLCNEMLDAILEGYPKSKKHLIEEIGIETDDVYGFTLEEIQLKI